MDATSVIDRQTNTGAMVRRRLTAMTRRVAAHIGMPVVLGGATRVVDGLLLTVTGMWTANAMGTEVARSGGAGFALSIFATALLATSLFRAFGLYGIRLLGRADRAAGLAALGWTLAVAGLGAAAFTLHPDRDAIGLWLAGWYVTGLAGAVAVRVAAAMTTRVVRNAGLLTRNAVIYGVGGSSDALVAALRNDPTSDVALLGVFDDRGDGRATPADCGVPMLGDISSLMALARAGQVDVVIMALPMAAESRVSMLLRRLGELPVDIRLAATSSTLRFSPRAYSYIGSVPVIDLSDRPIAGWNAVAKALFDKVIAAVALVALAPIMLLVAAAVKLESHGPVFFRQKRYGFNNELIEVFKFRSMYVDQSDATAARLVTRDDPRVTRVGRVIRKTSLDELPQLFNVLLGTLSLVGPRPHAVQAKAADRLYPDVVDGYFARHKVKPGITGWAQINGWRGETDTPEKIQKRVEFDLDYIENWSIWLDICILARTPMALLSTDSAY